MSDTESVLRVENLTFGYNKEHNVLSNLHMNIDAGEIVGLVGPNGSGKSTLIKLIFDLLEVTSGTIDLVQRPHRSAEGKRSAIYLPTEDYLPEFLTGQEYVDLVTKLYGADPFPPETVNDWFDRFGMNDRQHSMIEDYSHGMKKKVQLLTGFMLKRHITVIDETFNGIDLEALRLCRQQLMTMRESGQSFLLCTHDFGLLENVADRIILLKNGELLEQIRMEDVRHANQRLGDLIDSSLFGESKC